MKKISRQKLLALCATALIFAAVAAAFLRPAPNVFGSPEPIFEPGERIELSGDAEYFEYAEVEAIVYYDGGIRLKLPPVEPLVLLPGSRVDPKYGMVGVEEGYIEKLEDGEWEYLSPTGIGGTTTMEGGPPRHFSLSWNIDEVPTKYGQYYYLDAGAALREPGEYRFTLNFRQVAGERELVGDIITISFNCTVPEPTDKRLDYMENRGHLAVCSNDGSPAPYLVADSWVITSVASGEAFDSSSIEFYSPYRGGYWQNGDLPEEEWTLRTYCIFMFGTQSIEYGEYDVRVEFADNADGSGARYVLNYRTTLGIKPE